MIISSEYQVVIEKAEALAKLEEVELSTKHLLMAMSYSHCFGGWVLRNNGISHLTLEDLHVAYSEREFKSKEVSILDLVPPSPPKASVLPEGLSAFRIQQLRNSQKLTDVIDCGEMTSQSERDHVIYEALTEATHSMLDAGSNGYAWVVVRPAVAELFKLNSAFIPLGHDSSEFDAPCIGTLYRRWNVYEDTVSDMRPDMILLGVGDECRCLKLTLKNFIF